MLDLNISLKEVLLLITGGELALSCNKASRCVMDSIAFQVSFPVSRRVARPDHIPTPIEINLEEWAKDVGVEVGPLTPFLAFRAKIWLYFTITGT